MVRPLRCPGHSVRQIDDQKAMAALVAEDEPPAGGPALQQFRKRRGLAYLRYVAAPALLGGFDGEQPHALLLHTACRGAARHDRHQRGRAEFDRLADDQVAGSPFQRREQEPEIDAVRLRREQPFDAERDTALFHRFDPAQPFAVAPVERGDRVARSQPHDVFQVVGSVAIEHGGSTARERLVEE